MSVRTWGGTLLILAMIQGLVGCRSSTSPAPKRTSRTGKAPQVLRPEEKRAVLKRRVELYQDRVPEAQQKRIVALAAALAQAARKCFDEHVGHIQLDLVKKGALERFNFVRADAGPCGKLATMLNSSRQPLAGNAARCDALLIEAAEFVDWYAMLKRFVNALKARPHREYVVRAVGKLQRLTEALEKQSQAIRKIGKYLKKKESFKPPAREVSAVRKQLAEISRGLARTVPGLVQSYRSELAAGATKRPFRLSWLQTRRIIAEREMTFLSAEVARLRSGNDAFDQSVRAAMKAYFAALSALCSELKQIEAFLANEPGWKKTRAKNAFAQVVEKYNEWVTISNGLDKQLAPP